MTCKNCKNSTATYCNECMPNHPNKMSEELKKEWEISFEKMEKYHGWIPEHKERIKSFISSLLAKQQEDFVKMIKLHNDRLKSCLLYCQEQNGRTDCKNCGLCEEDLLADIKSKLK